MDQKQLRVYEDQCVQEHAPACTATCPLHVDVRGFCAAIAEGDFNSAVKIYKKTVPFPWIISSLCDQPCIAACLRKEIGGSIAIRSLEKSILNFGGTTEPPRAFPAKPRNIAVIGAGISGLTAAHDLAKKGYRVTIFEKESESGGILRNVSNQILNKEIIRQDLSILAVYKVEMLLSTEINFFRYNPEEKLFYVNEKPFHAVYTGIGATGKISSPVRLEKNQLNVDPSTGMTEMEGVFAGGSLVYDFPISHPETGFSLSHSLIQSMADGRKNALSIDRYLQNVSLTASRVNEGSYQTRLYTNLKYYPPLSMKKPQNPDGVFNAEEALQEAKRCIQCECMECVKECVYLQEYGSYPKRYVREIYNNLSIVSGTRVKNRMINSCSLCGLCAEICPGNLDMGEVCLGARQTMVEQKRMPPSAHDFALTDLRFSNSEHFSLYKHQPGTDASSLLFFPGCQLCASAPDYVEKLYNLLIDQNKHQGKKGVGLALGCCGAPAEWAGQTQLFEETQQKFRTEYQAMGSPMLLVACSTCLQMFRKNYPEINIQSLWVYLNEMALKLPDLSASGISISIHDPCTTRHENEIHASVRSLLDKLGVSVEELPLARNMTECCGYGGLMWLANRSLSEKVVARRINQNKYDYLTYCAMCHDFFAKSGKATYHLLDFLFQPDSLEKRKTTKPAGYSFRRENRARLKSKLLSTLWGGTMKEPEPYQKIQITMSDQVRELLEERMILDEDVQKVIFNAESKNNKFFNAKNGNFLAYYCPTTVTFWVEYQPQGGKYHVVNAYCHRMTIEEEVQE